MSNKPNPGSKEAQVLGCVCPVLDNSYGKGYLGDGEKFGFIMNEHCPIHGTNQSPVTDKAWSFIQQFKRAIKRFNHSQRNVAKALGISEGSLSHILKGERLSLATKLTKDIRHYITYGTFKEKEKVKVKPIVTKEPITFRLKKFIMQDIGQGQNRKPIGCMVARLVPVSPNPDSPYMVAIGVSLCNTEYDKFNKRIAEQMAIMRATLYYNSYKLKDKCLGARENKFHYLHNEINEFIEKCSRYYKDKNIILPKIIFV